MKRKIFYAKAALTTTALVNRKYQFDIKKKPGQNDLVLILLDLKASPKKIYKSTEPTQSLFTT